MSRNTVLVVTGSRAEYGLLRCVLASLDAEPTLTTLLAVAGSHLIGCTPTIEEIRRERRIDATIPMQVEGACTRQSDARALARGIEGVTDVLARLEVNLLLVLGDRIEVFAAASAASICGIHIAHIHGGDVASGVADESMRHAITKLAHVHFPATEESAFRIRRMGESGDSIFMVGSPAVDGLDGIAPLEDSRWKELGEPRFAVLLHPTGERDSVEQERAGALIQNVSGRGETVLFEPNLDPGRVGIVKAMSESGLRVVGHLDRPSFVGLLRRLDVLVGNSSAGLLECAPLGVPAVDVGTRQAGRELPSTAVHVASFSGPEFDAAFDEALSRCGGLSDRRFGDGNAGARIAHHLAGLELSTLPVRKRWANDTPSSGFPDGLSRPLSRLGR